MSYIDVDVKYSFDASDCKLNTVRGRYGCFDGVHLIKFDVEGSQVVLSTSGNTFGIARNGELSYNILLPLGEEVNATFYASYGRFDSTVKLVGITYDLSDGAGMIKADYELDFAGQPLAFSIRVELTPVSDENA
jgi:uncharacterized beta-barrel protein YwiB (DUF1934 family)